jgi:hypothetical protein
MKTAPCARDTGPGIARCAGPPGAVSIGNTLLSILGGTTVQVILASTILAR